MIVLKFAEHLFAKRIEGIAGIISGLKKTKQNRCRLLCIRRSHWWIDQDESPCCGAGWRIHWNIQQNSSSASAGHHRTWLKKDKALHDFMEETFSELHDILHGVYLVRELSARTLDFISGHGGGIVCKNYQSLFQLRKKSLPVFSMPGLSFVRMKRLVWQGGFKTTNQGYTGSFQNQNQ